MGKFSRTKAAAEDLESSTKVVGKDQSPPARR